MPLAEPIPNPYQPSLMRIQDFNDNDCRLAGLRVDIDCLYADRMLSRRVGTPSLDELQSGLCACFVHTIDGIVHP